MATMVVDAATVRKENSIRLFSLPLPSTLTTWKVYDVPAARSVALYVRAGAEWKEIEWGAVSVCTHGTSHAPPTYTYIACS